MLRSEVLGVRQVQLGRLREARPIRLQPNPGTPALSVPRMAWR